MTTRGCHDCEEPAAGIRADRTTTARLVVRLVRGPLVDGNRDQPRRTAPRTRLRVAVLVVPPRLPRRPRLREARDRRRPPLSGPHTGRDAPHAPALPLVPALTSLGQALPRESASPPRAGLSPARRPSPLLAQPPQRRPRLGLLAPRHPVRRPGPLVQVTARGPRHRLLRAPGPALRQGPTSDPRHPYPPLRRPTITVAPACRRTRLPSYSHRPTIRLPRALNGARGNCPGGRRTCPRQRRARSLPVRWGRSGVRG